MLEIMFLTISTVYIRVNVLHFRHFRHTPQGGTEVLGGRMLRAQEAQERQYLWL
jgi:hypothetical protein